MNTNSFQRKDARTQRRRVFLTADERKWTQMKKEGRQNGLNECDEDDPRVLAALDEALAKADATPGQGHSGLDVRAWLNE